MRGARGQLGALAAGLLLTLSPGLGGAARPKPKPTPERPPPSVTPGKFAGAERRYQEAMHAFEAGERVRARSLFEAVLSELPADHLLFAKTLYNLAFLADADVGSDDAGATCRAERAYARYLDAAPLNAEHERTRSQAELRRRALGPRCDAERVPVTVAVTTEESAPEPRADWLLPAAGVGAGLALGAGVGLQFWAQSALGERDRAWRSYLEVADPGAAARKQRAAERAQGDAELRVMASYLGFGLGATLVGTAAWLWLTDSDRASSPPDPHPDPEFNSEPVPDIMLMVLPGGLGVQGAF